MLWFWHSPGPYDASLQINYVYWMMQISIIATGIALWQALARSGPLTVFLAVTATGVQMSHLGAVLTFARDPLFSVHGTHDDAVGADATRGPATRWLIDVDPRGSLVDALFRRRDRKGFVADASQGTLG